MADRSQPTSPIEIGTIPAVTKSAQDFVSSDDGESVTNSGRGGPNSIKKDVRHIGRQRKYPHPVSAKNAPTSKFDHRKWLNTRETAEYLGTTEGNIRNLASDNRIQRYKPFGILLFEKTDLDRKVLAARIW